MGQSSHLQSVLERYKPAVRAAVESRNYKYIADEFEPDTTPDEMEGNCNEPGAEWSWITCPYAPACASCGRYECHSDHFVVAIDGACRGNGTTDARAAISVFFGPNNVNNFVGLLDYDREPTSQKAELSAAIKALEIYRSIRDVEPDMKKCGKHISLTIKTDSAYLVNSMTDYIFKWKKNNFKSSRGQPVKNKDLFIYIDDLLSKLVDEDRQVFFWHVPREYNTQADELVNLALDAEIGMPTVNIVVPHLIDYPWLVETYKSLLAFIKERAHVNVLQDTGALDQYVTGPNTRFLFLDEGGVDIPKQMHFSSFVRKVRDNGSRVVLGGLLPTTAQAQWINDALREIYKVQWQVGIYTNDEFVLNHKNRNVNTEGLAKSHYSQVLVLKNVPKSQVMYQTKTSGEVYAACTKIGMGFVGYIGDVNLGPFVDRAILALLGLPPVYEEHPCRLMTRATKVKLGYGDAWIDEDYVQF